MPKKMYLTRYLIEEQRVDGAIPGQLRLLLEVVARACKRISLSVNKGALGGVLGSASSENVQGEVQKQLDIIANEVLIEANEWGGHLAAMASEEMEGIYVVPHRYPQGEYLLLFDPLDGSSNIDVNVSIGTIFSVYKRISTGPRATLEDFLQPGTAQVAAGYIVYSSSTMLVYSTGHGVNGFTLDPSIGTFCLSHPDMKTPSEGRIYSINEGNWFDFSDGVRNYIDACKKRKMSARYIGSLVADFHRNLLKGGVYLYPGTQKTPKGKLRLLYEANPLAFLVEQAGGMATDGTSRILDLKPAELHQRCPLYIGSKAMVEEAQSMR